MNRILNIPMIARTLGFLLLIEAAFMVVPVLVALGYGDPGSARAFGIAAGATLAAGLGATFLIRPKHRDMSRRDFIMLTALIWVVFSLFGLIPYMLAPSAGLDFSEAFFEAMSSFTTTGASLVDNTDDLSHALHLWHCMSEWIGGLGIILFTLALVPMFNSSGGMQMFNAEQTQLFSNKLSPRISSTARLIWVVYILLSAILFVLLWLGPMSAFEAICHAMATMSTGGFSTYSVGINSFGSVYIKVIITIFMFIGGVNFGLIFHAASGRPGMLFHNDVFRAFCRCIAAATIITAVCVVANGAYTGWESITIDPLFQVVSFITSTGFMLSSYSNWGTTVMALSLILIFIGGCAGSTSGGAKIDRVMYMSKFLRNEVTRILRPNAVLSVRVSKRTVGQSVMNKVMAFLCLYTIIMLLGSLLLTICGVPMSDALVASLTAMSNISLSVADSTMGCDYQAFSDGAHFVLSGLMLTGRLEIFTIVVILSRAFWHR